MDVSGTTFPFIVVYCLQLHIFMDVGHFFT